MIMRKNSFPKHKMFLIAFLVCVMIVGFHTISYAEERNGISGAGVSVEDYFKVPYVSTYYFNPKPTINDIIQIPLYITDSEQSEYLENNTTKKMELIYTVDDKSEIIRYLPLGDYTLTIGQLSEGMHTFSVQVLDPTTGMRSHELFNELWVVDSDKEAITEKQIYKMTEQDLVTYKISNQNSTIAMDCISTRDGLNKLFMDKQSEGYRKIILLPGTYRISGEQTDTSYDSTQVHYILIPTHFTVDMNGSTFKLDTIENDHHGCIVEMMDAVDSHLINGTLEGDRFERQALGLESDKANEDCKGEGINTLLIKGGKYCSASNLIIKNTTGHAVGSGGVFGPDYTVISKVTNTAIFDGNEVKSDKCSTSSMVDISKITAWDEYDGYIFVAHLLGYKGIQGDSPIEYISFYDEKQNYINTVVGYQYRKIKVPANAKYLRATFLGQIETTGYEHTITVYTQHLGDYTAYQNLDFYDTRTTALVASCGSNILIEDCTYTRCGCSITPVAVDFEEGGEECQDLYYRNNAVIQNAETTTGTVVDCAGYNHVYENNIGHNIELRTRVMGGVVRNTNDTSSVVKWFIGTDKTGKNARIYNNDCGYIQFSDARLPAESRKNAVNVKVKDCKIHCGSYSEGIDAVADKVTYENCTIYNFFGSNATLRNCILQPTLEFGTNLYFYDCTFKSMNNSSDEIALNLPYIGDKVFDHCSFEGKTTLHSNGYKMGFGLGTYKNCTFDELKIYLRAEEQMVPTIFEKCIIRSAADDFIYVGAFSKDMNHINIQFKECIITQSGDSNLIYFYAKPNGDSQILFEDCTIDKTEGTLLAFAESDLENMKDEIAVNVAFNHTDVDRNLKVDMALVNPSLVRITYDEPTREDEKNSDEEQSGVGETDQPGSEQPSEAETDQPGNKQPNAGDANQSNNAETDQSNTGNTDHSSEGKDATASDNDVVDLDNGKYEKDSDGTTYLVLGALKEEDLKKNTQVSDKTSQGIYKITKIIKKDGKIVGGEVIFIKPYNKNCKTANIKASIKMAGVTFKITAIYDNAFKNCKKLKKVTIGSNISKIGKSAFYGCKNLKTISVKTKKLKSSKVGSKAFSRINKNAKITVPKTKRKLYKKIFSVFNIKRIK